MGKNPADPGGDAQARARHAHRHSSRHRPEIERSQTCGCFFCLREFAPRDIKDWHQERRSPSGRPPHETALCPFCGIDSVIGSASGYPITPDFLAVMRAVWFGPK